MPLHLAYSWVPVAAVQIAELAARVARVSLHVAMADAAADDDDDAANDDDDSDKKDLGMENFVTIKCCLKSLIRLRGNEKTAFLTSINTIVEVMSKLRVRALQAVTLFFLRSLGGDVSRSDEWFGSLVHGAGGDKFWRIAMQPGNPANEAQTFLQDIRKEIRDDEVLPTNISFILNSMARELSTAFRNHLSENFFARQSHANRAFLVRLHVRTPGGIVSGSDNECRKGINELERWITKRVNQKLSDAIDMQRFNELDENI